MPIAIVLQVGKQKMRGISFRVVFFLPTVLSIAVVGLIFHSASLNGIVNIVVNFGLVAKNTTGW